MILEQLIAEITKIKESRGGLVKLERDSELSGRCIARLVEQAHSPKVDTVEALAKAIGKKFVLVNEVESRMLEQYRKDVVRAIAEREQREVETDRKPTRKDLED